MKTRHGSIGLQSQYWGRRDGKQDLRFVDQPILLNQWTPDALRYAVVKKIIIWRVIVENIWCWSLVSPCTSTHANEPVYACTYVHMNICTHTYTQFSFVFQTELSNNKTQQGYFKSDAQTGSLVSETCLTSLSMLCRVSVSEKALSLGNIFPPPMPQTLLMCYGDSKTLWTSEFFRLLSPLIHLIYLALVRGLWLWETPDRNSFHGGKVYLNSCFKVSVVQSQQAS